MILLNFRLSLCLSWVYCFSKIKVFIHNGDVKKKEGKEKWKPIKNNAAG